MFSFKKASKQSLSQRLLVFGVGVNDAWYQVHGKDTPAICPIYTLWKNMLERCYSPKYLQGMPSYRDCYVCEEWLTFSNFKSWVDGHSYAGLELDKDVLSPGNKLYNPSCCVFIPKALNLLLNKCLGVRGEFPLGVTLDKGRKIKPYLSRVYSGGRSNHLGYFSTPEEASAAYNLFKGGLVLKEAALQSDPRIKEGLIAHAKLYYKGAS